MLLAGSPDYFNGQLTAASLLGMSPANQSKAAGASTPPVTAGAGDGLMRPWSLDSPQFWVAALAALTVLGMAGADARVRLFKRTAAVSVGQT